jgi:hypothetical protein
MHVNGPGWAQTTTSYEELKQYLEYRKPFCEANGIDPSHPGVPWDSKREFKIEYYSYYHDKVGYFCYINPNDFMWVMLEQTPIKLDWSDIDWNAFRITER